MLFIIGVIIVFGSVGLGYGGHGGNMAILWQPFEVIIIVGAAVGAMVISHPGHVLKLSFKSTKNLFKSAPYSKTDYIELLKFFFITFKLMKVKGMLVIESHIEDPKSSELFQKAPSILADHHAVDFICDYLRLLTMGVDDPHMFEDLIENEVELHEHHSGEPGHVWNLFGESLPALGIVAAVLGVITTMGSISEPPEVLGKLIGAALVGTFLGVLLSYGIFGPIGSVLTQYGQAEAEYYKCIKAAFISHLQGNAPTVTIEFVRKIMPLHLRPSFIEAEEAVNEQ